MRVLLVEDDQTIASPLVRGLEREGFAVDHTETGAGAVAALNRGDQTDVALRLDPEARTVPIIVVTARGDEVDRVVGLELGADDYVVKPFGLRELVARIRAVARRAVPRSDDPRPETGIVVDRRTRRVTVGTTEISMTPKEFDLLALLALDPGAVCERQRILDEVWDPHWYGPTKTLDVHIASLRRKLGDPGWIETVRGVGYRLRAEATES